ncbi:hypothetical protein [Arthrobacter sp. D5-1]|uniref:hypothetical protein n=1 Tax=Arthrobacter sp. D5-1 TaxID=1477518 RepID=UPI001A983CD0|nr:hypothetical protein [Arthrobacter sp. D5-1]QSZ47236.1 hypothetical protein AYX22_01595 [Arthrobacter sp. D5-1]
MALTSIFYDGPVTESDRAANRAGAADYGVYGPNDFKVTAHPSIPYAVLVKAGRAHGHGVTDEAEIDQVVNCPSLASGTRWDLIVIRRNWQPELGGPSVLVPLTAGAEAVIPASRKIGPGVEDDQPIGFVRWQGGTSAPVEFIDMRTWAGNGGLFARSTKVLGYLAKVGTEVVINGVTWNYRLGTNDTPGWTSTAPLMAPIALAAGYTPFGGGYDPSVHTEKLELGRVFSEGTIGTTAASINVDKARFRYKLGDVSAGHRPPFQKILRPPASPQLGDVTVYVYPDGVVEWECTQTAVLPKTGANGFFIGLDGFSWPAA